MKSLWCIILTSSIIHGAAHDAVPEEKIVMFEKNIKKLQQIDGDGRSLSMYFYYFFDGAGNKSLFLKPSNCLKRLADMPSFVRATNTKFKPGPGYLKDLIFPLNKEFDSAFVEKYHELKDISATWVWFSGYFKEKCLRQPLLALKETICAEDQQEQELALKDTVKGLLKACLQKIIQT